MKKENLNPYVRYVGKRCAPTPYPQLLCAYDYRLLLVTQGSIGVELKDRMIPLSAGNLMTIPPAVPYRLLFAEQPKLEYYIINFDFVSSQYATAARSPQPVEHFNTSDVFSREYLDPFGDVFVLNNAQSLSCVAADLYAEDLKNSEYSPLLTSSLMKYILVKTVV